MSSTEPSAKKRRSRILAIQKKNLVALIENYFTRTVGHTAGVNFDDINILNWQRIATILNTLGPSKTAEQWKSSFYYMTNRIRKKIEIVRQCGARPSDNLSEVDLRIFEMSPMVDYAMDSVFENIDSNEYGKNSFNVPPKSTVTSQEDIEKFGEDIENVGEGIENVGEDIENIGEDIENVSEFEPENCDLEGQIIENAELVDLAFGSSRHVVVSHTSAYSDAVVIEENINIGSVSEDIRVESNDDVQGECSPIVIRSPIRGAPSSHKNRPNIVQEDRNRRALSTESSNEQIAGQIGEAIENFPEVCDVNSFHSRIVKVRGQLPTDKQKMVPKSKKPVEEAKNEVTGIAYTQLLNIRYVLPQTSVRIPEIQKERLVQLIQNNFLKAVGQFAGSNGKFIKAQLWSKIAQELNTLGPPRTATQWKTTFNSIKGSAKAKLADYHNSIDGTMTQPLTRLEEKIVSIYGMNCMDGHQSLGESGFQYDMTIPDARKFRKRTISINTDNDADVTINLDNDTDLPINLDDDIDVPTNLDNDTDVPINLDIDDDDDVSFNGSNASNVNSFEASNEIYTEDYKDRVLAEIIQEIWNEPENNGVEPELNHVPDVAKKRSHDEMNDQSTTSSTRLSAHAPPQTRPSARPTLPSRARPALSPQVHSSAPSRAPPAAPPQARSLVPSRTRPAAPPQSRPAAPSQSRPAAPSQSRPAAPSQSLPAAPSQSRPAAPSQSRSLVLSRARPLIPPRARPLIPPRARPRARASSPIEYLTGVNQFFNDNGEDSDDSSFGQNSTASRSIQNVDQFSKPKRDRTDLSNRITSFGMVQSSISAQERFIADSNRNHSEMMFLTDRNHLEMAGMFNSTINGLTDVVKEFLNRM